MTGFRYYQLMNNGYGLIVRFTTEFDGYAYVYVFPSDRDTDLILDNHEDFDTMDIARILADRRVVDNLPIFYEMAYSRIFIGMDTSGQYGSYHGSSLLLNDEGGPSHTYICDEVVKFQANQPIGRFESPMGEGLVPYPIAIGGGDTYLLWDNVYLTKRKITDWSGDDINGWYLNQSQTGKLKARDVRPMEIRLKMASYD